MSHEPGSNIEWKKWGDTDPLWGVASWAGKEKGGASPWTDEEFYELGRADWQDFLSHWEQYGLDHHACLEIGCGAGRLTKHMAASFERVQAVDVAEGMLEYAKAHVQLPSVFFVLSDGVTIPTESSSISAVFSAHVFQHFDSLEHATRYFAEINRVLQPGGSIMIHAPVFLWHRNSPSVLKAWVKIREKIAVLKAGLVRPLVTRGVLKPIMRGLEYPVNYFLIGLPKLGYERVEVRLFSTSSNASVHPFVFARKPVKKRL